jgi:CTP synthase
LLVKSKAGMLYGSFVIQERHRHRYEFNNVYREKFEQAGFLFSGLSPDGKLVELIELTDHPFFLACQFHPEFLSKPHQPHPLFKGLIAAAHQYTHQKPL